MKTLKNIIDDYLSLKTKELGKKYSKAEFSRAMGMSPQNINEVQSRNRAGIQVLNRLSKQMGIPIDQLLPYIDNKEEQSFIANEPPEHLYNQKPLSGQFIQLPYIPLSTVKQFIHMSISQGKTKTDFHFPVIKTEGIDYQNAIVFDVPDNAMEPTILEGSKILATKVEPPNWHKLNSGIYMIMFEEKLLLRRVINNELLLTSTLSIHADNPKHGYIIIDSQDIKHIWQFEAIIWATPK